MSTAKDLSEVLSEVKGDLSELIDEGKKLIDREDLVKTAVLIGLLEGMPDDLEDPDLNIMKMELSSQLLEAASEHQEKMNVLREKAKASAKGIFKKLAGIALKAAIALI